MENKTTESMSGPVPSVCRCCLAEGCYKDISTEYFWMGKREVYAEMLSETFDLSIAYAQTGGPNSHSHLICEPCISRLRDASEFKKQVQECEKTFMNHLDPCSTTVTVEIEPSDKVKLGTVKEEQKQSDSEDFEDRLGFEDDDDDDDLDDKVKLGTVKEEQKQSNPEDFEDRLGFENDDDDDDLDDQPLTKLASKPLKKEKTDLLDLLDNSQVSVKRKSTLKAKAPPAKKAKLKIKEKAKPSPSKAPTKTPKKKKGNEDPSPVRVPIKENVIPHGTKLKKEQVKAILGDMSDKKTREIKSLMLLENTKICPFKWSNDWYICFYCDQKFSDPLLLRNHHAEIHNYNRDKQLFLTAWTKIGKCDWIKVDITDVSCRLCDDIILNFSHLKLHLNDKHNCDVETKPNDGFLPFRITKTEFNCVFCDSEFVEYKTLNQHMNVHYQNFICEQCGTGFLTFERLRVHHFTHGDGSVACEECGKVFKSSNSKALHHITIHKQVKRSKCPHCSEKFSNHFQRNKHMYAAHGIKPKKRHACEICDMKFNAMSELKYHMLKHTGERKFECEVCKKAYLRKYTLREHMRIHLNDKRFDCKVCGKAFLQKCTMQKHHLRVHHPE